MIARRTPEINSLRNTRARRKPRKIMPKISDSPLLREPASNDPCLTFYGRASAFRCSTGRQFEEIRKLPDNSGLRPSMQKLNDRKCVPSPSSTIRSRVARIILSPFARLPLEGRENIFQKIFKGLRRLRVITRCSESFDSQRKHPSEGFANQHYKFMKTTMNIALIASIFTMGLAGPLSAAPRGKNLVETSTKSFPSQATGSPKTCNHLHPWIGSPSKRQVHSMPSR